MNDAGLIFGYGIFCLVVICAGIYVGYSDSQHQQLLQQQVDECILSHPPGPGVAEYCKAKVRQQ